MLSQSLPWLGKELELHYVQEHSKIIANLINKPKLSVSWWLWHLLKCLTIISSVVFPHSNMQHLQKKIKIKICKVSNNWGFWKEVVQVEQLIPQGDVQPQLPGSYLTTRRGFICLAPLLEKTKNKNGSTCFLHIASNIKSILTNYTNIVDAVLLKNQEQFLEKEKKKVRLFYYSLQGCSGCKASTHKKE